MPRCTGLARGRPRRLRRRDARSPSLLPEWSVGHVLTHIARNADSVVWRLLREHARASYGISIRVGSSSDETRSRRGRDGRPTNWWPTYGTVPRPWRGSWPSCPMRRGTATVADVTGRGGASHDAVFSRWREVVVHQGDLGLGPIPLPPTLVAAWLAPRAATAWASAPTRRRCWPGSSGAASARASHPGEAASEVVLDHLVHPLVR